MRRLPHRVTIQEATEARSSSGAVSQTWATFQTVWAKVETLSGRETFVAQQVQSSINARIRIRALSGVHEKMRVVHGDNTYDIEAVLEPSEREMHLMCVRRQAEGLRSGQ